MTLSNRSTTSELAVASDNRRARRVSIVPRLTGMKAPKRCGNPSFDVGQM